VITYLYWGLVFALAFGAVFLFGARFANWKGASIAAGIILFVGWSSYYFYLQQVFVKRYGGVMNVSVPKGQYHITATWKDDNLWIENYDPRENICIFSEYSKGNLLEGKVTIKNCNPLISGAEMAIAPASKPPSGQGR